MKFLASLLTVLCMAPFSAFAGTILIDAAHPDFAFSVSPCKGNIKLNFKADRAVIYFEVQGCAYLVGENENDFFPLMPEVAVQLGQIYSFQLGFNNELGRFVLPDTFMVDTKPAAHLPVTNGLLKR